MGDFTAHDFHTLSGDIAELKSAVREVVKALELLARLEERQDNARSEVDRAFGDIRDLKARICAIEIAQSARKTTNDWIDKGIYATLGCVGFFLLKKAGLL